MKTPSLSLKMALLSLSAVALSPALLAADGDKNANTNRDYKEGRLEREANRERGLNQTYNELVNNPDALFHKLDTDGNGQLSAEEFGRAVNLNSQGQVSTQGTQGIRGATGATGQNEGTSVGGQATPPTGQSGAKYGQQPDATGQPAANNNGQAQPGQQPEAAQQDAAASGQQQPANAQGQQPQQPQQPAPANAQPQPAPGQEPAPNGAPTAPVTKEGQEPAPRPAPGN